MMKNKVKIILIICVILILCLNIGVYAAYVLSSTQVSYTKPSGTATNVKNALDELYTKVQVPAKEIGDTVTVGGEQFYVLEWDNNSDTVDLISKYNLNTAGTAQQNATYSTTAFVFSIINYWEGSFTSSPFNLNDFRGFKGTEALGKAKSYGRSKGAVASRLLSYEEAKALKTKASSNTKIATMIWGKESTDGYLMYWLGSAYDRYLLWIVDGSDSNLYNSTYDVSSQFRGSPSYNSLKISNILKLRRSFARC